MGSVAFVNGTVHTVVPSPPRPEVVVTDGATIRAVGSQRDLRDDLVHAEVVDLGGRLLMPGFQDAHVHPSMAGLTMLRCDLHDVDGLPGYLDRVDAYARANPHLEWIVGAGWSMDAFPGGIPDRRSLDAVVADRPVFLVNRDGHGAWVNTVALSRAGIDDAAPDPRDGRIEREPDGTPVGTLQEGAMELVELPPVAHDDRIAGIVAAQRYLLSLGITTWQDAWVTPPDHDAYVSLAGDGRLVARVVGALWWERDESVDQVAGLAARRADSTDRYRATTVKIMLDGVCENHTAALIDPYLGGNGFPSGTSGIDFVAGEALPGIVAGVADAGFQVHFHAIGDRATRNALDAVAALPEPAALRHHIAHLQVVHPDDVLRFGALGVTGNAQPRWAHLDATQTELTMPFLGAERSRRQYPFASLAAAGARLAFGSDWSVTTPDPFEILHVAVHRTDPAAPDGPRLGAGEAVPLADAIAAYTMGSAYVNHHDDATGSITPGKAADLVVVDRDVLAAGVPIAGARVDMTMIGGEVVYERSG